MPNYLCNACLCVYTSLDLDDIKVGCVQSGECLCIKGSNCCAIGEKPYPIAVCDNKTDECLSIDLFCCRRALKTPDTLCSGAGHCLCIKEVLSCPFKDDYVKEPTCSVCFIACAPEAGFLKEAPKCPAIER